MAQESESIAPIVETRKVVIEYTINAPNVPSPQPAINPAALERFVLAVLRKNQMQGSSL